MVFWSMGYDGASMAELTKAMGMNAPSIYFAFGSKRGLFDAVLERYDQRRSAQKENILAAATAREAAEVMLFGAVEWLTATDEPLGCLLTQSGLTAGVGNPDIPIELARRRNRVETVMTERFKQGQLEGDLAIDVDAASLARYVELIFSGLCVQAASGNSREDLMVNAKRAMTCWPT